MKIICVSTTTMIQMMNQPILHLFTRVIDKHEIFTKDIAICTEDYNDLFLNDIFYTRNFDQQPKLTNQQ